MNSIPDEIEDDLYAKNQIEFPNNKDPYFYKEPIIGWNDKKLMKMRSDV